MSAGVIETPFAAASRISEELSRFGITPYVKVDRPGGAYCGATLLFDFLQDADLRFHAMSLVSSTRERFYNDKSFRAALSRECFGLGAYVQEWNEPPPDPNF